VSKIVEGLGGARSASYVNPKSSPLLTASENDVGAFAPSEPAPQVEVAELIVSCLEKAGVEYVFGVPGGAVEPIYNALARSARRGGPRAVVARHEVGAAYMADGYARETGRLGVCVATSGPGATNLLTGIACAHGSSVPLLALTGQSALPLFGRNALQDSSCAGVDIVGIFAHCTRYSSLVSHVEQAETKIAHAILHALRKPYGPTHLSFPVDILRGLVTPRSAGHELTKLFREKPCLIDERAVDALEAELIAASRIVFFIGDSAAEAVDSIMTLAELSGALFVTTPDAKGLINPRHPAYRGVFGLGGHASAQQVLADSPDLVVAFGTGFSEFASNAWSKDLLNSRLAHVDESEDNLFRSPLSKLHVRGRIRAICDRLVAAWPPRSYVNRRVAPTVGDASRVTLQAPDMYESEATPIKPQRLMKELSERFPPNTRFLADAGNSMMWTAHYLQPPNRRGSGARGRLRSGSSERRSGTASWLRMTLEFAPMGWAIGAAVGMARGSSHGPVVCITGDGSYLMSGQEITTAVDEKLPVVFVILNDHAYGMVMHGQRLAGAEPIAYELTRVDFRRMAEAMGIVAHVVDSPSDFEQIDFGAMLARNGPTLIDVRIDREEVPPMMLRLKTLGSVSA
jgi:acetolactate synthase-1/2/3 large subunit